MVVAQFKAALLQEAEADSVFAYSAKKRGCFGVSSSSERDAILRPGRVGLVDREQG